MVHDHRDWSCGGRVLQGTAPETVFERARNPMIYTLRSQEMRPGFICATKDDGIHQVSNLADDGGDLITLHIYSPALLQMGTYSLSDANMQSYAEPVHEDAESSPLLATCERGRHRRPSGRTWAPSKGELVDWPASPADIGPTSPTPSCRKVSAPLGGSP